VVFSDITNILTLESRYKSLSAVWKTYIDLSRDAVIVVGIDHRIQQVSDSEGFLGVEPESLVGTSVSEFVAAFAKHNVLPSWNETIKLALELRNSRTLTINIAGKPVLSEYSPLPDGEHILRFSKFLDSGAFDAGPSLFNEDASDIARPADSQPLVYARDDGASSNEATLTKGNVDASNYTQSPKDLVVVTSRHRRRAVLDVLPTPSSEATSQQSFCDFVYRPATAASYRGLLSKPSESECLAVTSKRRRRAVDVLPRPSSEEAHRKSDSEELREKSSGSPVDSDVIAAEEPVSDEGVYEIPGKRPRSKKSSHKANAHDKKIGTKERIA
jgi:hypothetical protein